MNEDESKSVGNSVTTTNVAKQEDSAEQTEKVGEAIASVEEVKKSPVARYTAAVLVVVVILLGVLYLLEKEKRSATTIFSSLIESQENNEVVAVVNGEEIVNSELKTSIQQFSQAATAQGVDLSNPDAQTEIRNQALDVLVNTELLKQEAETRGITVTDEQVTERLETIKAEIGGEEVLAERMTTLGIDKEQLYSDIQDEIIIKQLLDMIFLEANITVTEEEIAAVYENAGGSEAGLPPLEEVRIQVEEQIKTSKEQEAIDRYLTELKTDAQIEIK